MSGRHEGGSALVMALLILVVAQALVLAVTTRATLAARAALRAENRALALEAAEAGLAEALQRLVRDNVATDGQGEMGLVSWAVEGDEELVEPMVSLATFTATARSREQVRRVRLRVLVRREELGAVTSLKRLDWTMLP